MNQMLFKLEKILDLDKWQTLQDSMSLVTQLAIITVDYKGTPITTHSCCHPFCQHVRNDPELSGRCQKCDSRGGLESVRSNRPYIYLCHYNIIDIAIPISISDKYVGAVMAGQVRLSPLDTPENLEQILNSPTSLNRLAQCTELQQLYETIPTLSYEKIRSIAEMLFHLCNYIVDEAKNKNFILEMYENLLSVGKYEFLASSDSVPTINSIAQLKNVLSNAVTNTYIHSDADAYSSVANKLLLPAFEYIFTNKNKSLSLREAASICHLSPSYFSRLFARETGESFTAYTTTLKIEWAKQLLEKTDLSITQISDELAFNDPGYFIKTFKKQENITPSVYRKYFSPVLTHN